VQTDSEVRNDSLQANEVEGSCKPEQTPRVELPESYDAIRLVTP
jgi:hypothetical protein